MGQESAEVPIATFASRAWAKSRVCIPWWTKLENNTNGLATVPTDFLIRYEATYHSKYTSRPRKLRDRMPYLSLYILLLTALRSVLHAAGKEVRLKFFQPMYSTFFLQVLQRCLPPYAQPRIPKPDFRLLVWLLLSPFYLPVGGK